MFYLKNAKMFELRTLCLLFSSQSGLSSCMRKTSKAGESGSRKAKSLRIRTDSDKKQCFLTHQNYEKNGIPLFYYIFLAHC
jgi:hypothetical protein